MTSSKLSASKVTVALLAIVCVSLFLRCWGITWGLPRQERFTTLYVDEYTPLWVLHQMNPRKGDFNPHYSHNPTFFYYQIGVALSIASKAGLISLENDKTAYLEHPEKYAKLYLVGRALCIVYGVAMTVLMFFLGKRFAQSDIAGLLTALFYAIIPVSVIQAHVIDTSIPGSFWLGVSFLGLLKALDTKQSKWLYLGALAAGLSISTKYTCAPIGLVVIAAAWWGSHQVKPIIVSLLVLGAAYLLGTPYMLLDTAHMMSGLLEMSQSAVGLNFKPSLGTFYYPLAHYGYAVGWPLSIAALIGFCMLIRAGRREPYLSALFLIPFLGLLARSSLHITRYVNETLPFILPFASCALIALYRRPQTFYRMAAVIFTVLCFSQVPYTLAIDRSLSTEVDPRDQASDWVVQHIPAGRRIGMEQEANFMMPAHLYMDYWKGQRYPADFVSPPHYTYSLWKGTPTPWDPQTPDYWIETHFFFDWVYKNSDQRNLYASYKSAMPLGYVATASFKRDIHWGPIHYPFPALGGNDWLIFFPEIIIHERA